jgi:hypothetical protein
LHAAKNRVNNLLDGLTRKFRAPDPAMTNLELAELRDELRAVAVELEAAENLLKLR